MGKIASSDCYRFLRNLTFYFGCNCTSRMNRLCGAFRFYTVTTSFIGNFTFRWYQILILFHHRFEIPFSGLQIAKRRRHFEHSDRQQAVQAEFWKWARSSRAWSVRGPWLSLRRWRRLHITYSKTVQCIFVLWRVVRVLTSHEPWGDIKKARALYVFLCCCIIYCVSSVYKYTINALFNHGKAVLCIQDSKLS